ncbi:MAG: hypothetical protein AAGA92_15760 [Planctomycetota bacterium]
MTTELAVVDTGNYLALQDGGAIAEAMAANLGDGAALKESDLTKVPIPSGGGTTWMVPSITGEAPEKAIEGVLVYQCVRGVLWPREEPEEGTLPALVTDDLKIARIVSQDLSNDFLESIAGARNEDGTYRWADLPQCEWGSGKNGHGKAAKEQRVLFILREQEPLPLVVAIQPGSLKNWRGFIMELTKAGIPFWRAVISLGLEKSQSGGGQPFSKVVPSLVGVLSDEQGKVIREKFTEPMRAVAASGSEG